MDLDRFMPALLTFVANRLGSTGSATFRRRFNIGMMDFRILAMLSVESNISGARIADVIDLDKAAVSRTLQSLKRRRLVSITPGPGRIRIATLTPAGRALYDRAYKVSQERERLLLTGFSRAEHEVLIDFVRRMLANTPRLTELASQEPDKKK
jgi:DNA-binding MarR family transcriptional regulator